MKQIYLGLILICTFVFVGCSEKIGDKFYPSENYVTRYQDPLSSYAAVYGSIDEYPVPSQSVVQFMINLRVTESTVNSQNNDIIIDRQTDATKFKELAQKFNDTEYNMIHDVVPPPVMYVQFLYRLSSFLQRIIQYCDLPPVPYKERVIPHPFMNVGFHQFHNGMFYFITKVRTPPCIISL